MFEDSYIDECVSKILLGSGEDIFGFDEYAVESYADELDNIIYCASYMYEGVGNVIGSIVKAVKDFVGKTTSIFKKTSSIKMKEVIDDAEHIISLNPALGYKKIKYDGKKITVKEAIAIAKTDLNKAPSKFKKQLEKFNAKANSEPTKVKEYANETKTDVLGIFSKCSNIVKNIGVAVGVPLAVGFGIKYGVDKVGDGISGVFNFGKKTGTKAAGSVASTVKKTKENIDSKVDAAATKIKKAGEDVTSAAKDLAAKTVDKTGDIAKNTASAIKNNPISTASYNAGVKAREVVDDIAANPDKYASAAKQGVNKIIRDNPISSVGYKTGVRARKLVDDFGKNASRHVSALKSKTSKYRHR